MRQIRTCGERQGEGAVVGTCMLVALRQIRTGSQATQSDAIRRNQTQSDAIRRKQPQSAVDACAKYAQGAKRRAEHSVAHALPERRAGREARPELLEE